MTFYTVLCLIKTMVLRLDLMMEKNEKGINFCLFSMIFAYEAKFYDFLYCALPHFHPSQRISDKIKRERKRDGSE